MTEEEYFRKNYPDYCYGDRLLSPYWDLFQDGVEFGERQSEKKIAELKAENELIKNSDSLCKLIGEQKQQIEKMKRCVICRHWHCENNICWLEKEGKCHNKSMWELD